MSAPPSEKQLANRLKGVPLFGRTTGRQRTTLARLGKVVSWKQGSTPITEGSKGAAFFLLLDGAAEVDRGGTTVARLGADEFVGEMALLTNEPRNATVTATQDSTVFALGRPALSAAVSADPAIAIALLEAVAKRQQLMQ